MRPLAVSAVVLLLSLWEPAPLRRAALTVQDRLCAALPPRLDSSSTCVVAIDTRSVEYYGQWPWGPEAMGRLVSAVSRGAPRVIGIDPCSGPSTVGGGAALSGAVRDAETVVGFSFSFGAEGIPIDPDAIASSKFRFITNPWGEVRGYPVPRARGAACIDGAAVEAAAGCGFTNVTPNRDGVVRTVPLVAEEGEGLYESFAVAVAARYISAARITLKLSGEEVSGVWMGRLLVGTLPDGGLPVRGYRSGAIPVLSAVEVLEGAVDPGIFRRKAVLIGASGGASAVLYRTRSLASEPPVVLQATAVENMLRDQYLRESAISRLAFLVLVAGLPVLVWLCRRGVPRFAAALGLCAVACGVSAVFLGVRSEQVLFFYPSMGVLCTWAACGFARKR